MQRWEYTVCLEGTVRFCHGAPMLFLEHLYRASRGRPLAMVQGMQNQQSRDPPSSHHLPVEVVRQCQVITQMTTHQ